MWQVKSCIIEPRLCRLGKHSLSSQSFLNMTNGWSSLSSQPFVPDWLSYLFLPNFPFCEVTDANAFMCQSYILFYEFSRHKNPRIYQMGQYLASKLKKEPEFYADMAISKTPLFESFGDFPYFITTIFLFTSVGFISDIRK